MCQNKLFSLSLSLSLSLSIWKFYNKLMNNQLPTYFSQMKPVLPVICTRYEVRKPMFHLPDIRHSFGEQSIGYCLIKRLNAAEDSLTTDMVLTESFFIYKVHIKRAVIDAYRHHCEIDNCYVCNRKNHYTGL